MDRSEGHYAYFRKLFAAYWRCYGGTRAFLFSPYLHLALLITAVLWPAWWDREWWGTVLQVLPNIVGFSIGGYAIWLGFGDEKFKALMAQRDSDGETTPYMEVSATFCHFVVVQLLAIVFALGASAFTFERDDFDRIAALASTFGVSLRDISAVLRPIAGAVGFLLFTYAITTAMAAVFAIFQVAQWFDSYRAALSAMNGHKRSAPGSSGSSEPGPKQPPRADSGNNQGGESGSRQQTSERSSAPDHT